MRASRTCDRSFQAASTPQRPKPAHAASRIQRRCTALWQVDIHAQGTGCHQQLRCKPNIVIKDLANNAVKDLRFNLEGFGPLKIATVPSALFTCSRVNNLVRMPRRDDGDGVLRRRSV